MKQLTLIYFILLSLFPCSVISQTNFTADQKEVNKTIVLIGEAWSQNNLDTLEKYIHQDYKHSDVRGQLLDRSAWLSYVKDRKDQHVSNPKVEFEEVEIKIYGDFALVTGINIFTGQAYTGNENKPVKPSKIRFTQVLKKENNVWERILFQATYVETK